MADDNIVLTSFLLLPIATVALLFLFVRKQRKRSATKTETAKTETATAGSVALILGNGLLFLVLCSAVLLGGELYYRFVYDTTDSFGLTKTTTRWIDRHYVLNNFGIRDSRDYRTRLHDGSRRVTFLGDSFTAGHGVADVEKRFANRFRAARPDVDVQVVAINGYDTGYEIELIGKLKHRHNNLDLVVLVYCLNDISDISPQWKTINERIHQDSDPGYLFQHSFFLNTLYYRWTAGHDADVADYYRFVIDDYRGPVWEQQKERLRTLRDVVTGGGGRLVVVTFPFLHSLGPNYPFAQVHKQLNAFWNALHIPHLDLLNVFGTSEPSELVVNRFDAHPNEFAHALAAKEIANFLDEQLKNPAPGRSK